MVTTEVHPIFEDCKATERTRYDIDRVCVVDSWRCATDGRIFVREPCIQTKVNVDKFPNARNLPWDKPTIRVVPMPADIPSDTEHKCEECHASGDCCNCGEGKCPECNGLGEWTTGTPIKVDQNSNPLSSIYARKLKKHGVTELEIIAEGEGKPLRFRVPNTEIVGLVMPMKSLDEK